MFSIAPVLVFVYLPEAAGSAAGAGQEPEAEAGVGQEPEAEAEAAQLEVVETVVLVSGELKLEAEPQWSQ